MAPLWRVDGQGYMRVPAEGEAAGTPRSASSTYMRTLLIAGLVEQDPETRPYRLAA
jgi:DNA-binding IclR family transcriptional regulator